MIDLWMDFWMAFFIAMAFYGALRLH